MERFPKTANDRLKPWLHSFCLHLIFLINLIFCSAPFSLINLFSVAHPLDSYIAPSSQYALVLIWDLGFGIWLRPKAALGCGYKSGQSGAHLKLY